MRKRLGAMGFAVLLCHSSPALAADWDDWQLRGFGTLAATYNSDLHADYVRNIAQPDQEQSPWSMSQDSLLGGQVNYRHPRGRLGATLQAVTKYRYDGSYTPDISLAFLNYHISDRVQLRVGRQAPGVLLRSDSRDVGYSYLWARPPVEFYGVINLSRFDGADLQWRYFSGQTMYRLQGFLGLSHEKVYGKNGQIFDYDDSVVRGLIFERETNQLTLRASALELQLNSELPSITQLNAELNSLAQLYSLPHLSHLADDFSVEGKRVHYYSIGAVWETNNWTLQTGATLFDSNFITFPDLNTHFISLGYQAGLWTPYVVYAKAVSDAKTQTTGLGAAVDEALLKPIAASSQVDQLSLSVGTRYELSQSTAIKVQYDYVKSEVKEGLLVYSKNPEKWDGDLNTLTLGLDFIF